MKDLVCGRPGCNFVCNNQRDWKIHASRVHSFGNDDPEKCANTHCRALRRKGQDTCTMSCRIAAMKSTLDRLGPSSK